MVIRMLGEETEVLKIENEIQDELKTQIDKNQKEYYLREQIKVIQTELGEDVYKRQADGCTGTRSACRSGRQDAAR